ncbi:hypothetical protein DUQ00_08635 [Salmonella bongori]|uniref:Uncharacterized protein n=1 Tax=Salmonella bongori serovar 44:r:- TaxID=1967585 RepID=A0A702BS67_SALBN|nr:hypothetical protein [Salmonella bongori]HAC6695717.1 hypothetical protein [Salmonella bongori serovar 44:r:-]ECC8922829.1 hypothetical protein [Salmonella bongori]ECC9596393.1 hypothetical protein [Salmonella bongori]ECE6548149.1 hypothetical protein [Salmonella bongori]
MAASLACRYDATASLSKTFAQAVCVTTRVNHYQKSHHAEIPSFIPEPCSDVGRSFCPTSRGENGCDNRCIST